MEIRRSYDRLMSTMGFPLLARWHLYIESGWMCKAAGHRPTSRCLRSCLHSFRVKIFQFSILLYRVRTEILALATSRFCVEFVSLCNFPTAACLFAFQLYGWTVFVVTEQGAVTKFSRFIIHPMLVYYQIKQCLIKKLWTEHHINVVMA